MEIWWSTNKIAPIQISHILGLHRTAFQSNFLDIDLNTSRPDPGQREKINLNISFLHFFAVPQKVL